MSTIPNEIEDPLVGCACCEEPAEQAESDYDGFFFLEGEILESSGKDWERDEFALYLLICRGYNPKSAGSTYGESGCKRVIGLTRKPWMRWTQWLEARGLIRTIERGMHPVTLMSSASSLFERTFKPTSADYRQYDGRRWNDLVNEGRHLIKIPWRAMDIDRMNPETRIGALVTIQAIRLLVWAYDAADADGWIPSNHLWLEAEVEVAGRCSQEARDRLSLSPDEVRDAVMELLRSGLVESRELDAKGRGILFLAHPMSLVTPYGEDREAA